MENHQNKEPEHFTPKGTMAFMILLLLLTAAVWFSVYNIQLERH
jgi:hypothetical protein